ncbi:MAG: hypothetical protein LJE70_11565 [Chromatiaceae bacterium]|jgi:hypothetical protein|nr:hypothetical protein [Chromatiaceae bacterium]
MKPSDNDDEPADDRVDRLLLQRLRKLIGRNCDYVGKKCLVVDVLSDEHALILEAREHLPPIQSDQYGRAAHRSNEMLQIPIFDDDRTKFSEELMDLFASLHVQAERNASDAIRSNP